MPFILGGWTSAAQRWRFTATPPPAPVQRWRFTAQPDFTPVHRWTFTATPALPAFALNVTDLVHTAIITGLPGEVLDWEYTHNGGNEELRVDVHGLHGLSLPSVTFAVTTERLTPEGRVPFSSLPVRTFTASGAEPREDRARGTTTFLFRHSHDHLLRGVRLPELVSWHLFPPADPCLTFRRNVGVSALVHEAMKQVTSSFRIEGDPLTGAMLEEGYTDFSTEGMTPQAVWDAFHGAIGMVLHVEDGGLVGRWGVPINNRSGFTLPAGWRTGFTAERQFMQVPSRLVVKAADGHLRLTDELLLAWIGARLERNEVERELAKDAQWVEGPFPSGTSRVWYAWRKEGGQITASAEVTTSDVEIKETVDGVEIVTVIQGVATGYKYTETTFDPEVPARPLRERTQTLAWGWDLQTTPKSFSPALGLPGVQAGDLTGDEETRTAYQYARQGWQSGKVTQTRKLSSLKQQGADSAPEDRGVLEGNEYVTTVQTERWNPTAAGLWLYSADSAAQTPVAVYDADSGEAVRTAVLTRSSPTPPRLTDQAPPSFPLHPCEDVRDVRAPSGVTLSVEMGQAEEETLSFPWMEPRLLTSLPRQLLAGRWARIQSEITLPFVLNLPPGSWTDEGRVERLTLKPGENGQLSMSLTCVRLDTETFGQPMGYMELLRTPSTGGKAVMLFQTPDGAWVEFLRGWNVSDNTPLREQGEVRFRTGFPPRPGAELDWTLVNGRREATGAR